MKERRSQLAEALSIVEAVEDRAEVVGGEQAAARKAGLREEGSGPAGYVTKSERLETTIVRSVCLSDSPLEKMRLRGSNEGKNSIKMVRSSVR